MFNIQENIVIAPINTYRIIPDYNITNSNNKSIADVFSNIYKTPKERINIKDFTYTLPNQICFDIVFKRKQSYFYITSPKDYSKLIENKMNTIWNKSEIKEVKNIGKFREEFTECCELILKDYNFKSLSTSKGDLYPLTNMMGILKMLDDNEQIRVNIAIEPIKRIDWIATAQDEYKEYQRGKILDNEMSNSEKAAKLGFTGAEALINLYIDFKLLMFESILGLIIPEKDELSQTINLKIDSIESIKNSNKYEGLTPDSIYKLTAEAFKVKISIVSQSRDSNRRKLNMLSVANSYKDLNSDNSLVPKLLSKNEQHKLFEEVMNGYKTPSKNLILSDKEVCKLIQLPQKDLQKEYSIQSIDTREVDVPAELQNGLIRIGIAEKQGKVINTHWSTNKNIMALAKVFIGPQYCGKTTAIKRTVKDCYKAGYSNVIIDYIENCDTAKEIMEVVKEEDRVILDLGKKDYIPSMSYNEVSRLINEEMDSWDRITLSNLISEQIEYLINAITDSTTGDLTAPMLRYLHAASMVTFIRPGAKINDVFTILRRWDKRNEAIRYAKYSGCFEKDDDIFFDLEELHERDKEGKIIGTREHLISGIINRIILLQKNPYLKRMLNTDIDMNEDLSQYIEEGKSIFILIPQTKFPNQSIRDILTTFYISRLWLTVQLRENNKEARLCNVFFDEVHQVPTTARFLSNHITEFRRHRLGLTLSCHFLKQLKDLFNSLKSSGASYVFIAGTEKENLECMKQEIEPFSVEEGLNLKPYTSLNLVNYGNQYAKFITRLPEK